MEKVSNPLNYLFNFPFILVHKNEGLQLRFGLESKMKQSAVFLTHPCELWMGLLLDKGGFSVWEDGL